MKEISPGITIKLKGVKIMKNNIQISILREIESFDETIYNINEV